MTNIENTLDEIKREEQQLRVNAIPQKRGGPAHGNLTVRDYFAAKAMCTSATFSEACLEEAAKWCYRIADAMMAARK